jgi:hypothetical protein
LNSGFFELKEINLHAVSEFLFVVKLLDSLSSILLLHVEDCSGTLALSAIWEMMYLQLHILDLTIL